MAMTEKKFQEWLALYGAEVESWPEDARAAGERALRDARFAALREDCRRLESLLAHAVVPASPALADRIIRAAYRTGAPLPRRAWLRELLSDLLLPKPAFALPAAILCGIVIGFSLSPQGTADDGTAAPAYIDEDGGIL